MSAPIFKTLLPVKIVSVSNLREHWRQRATRSKTHRQCAATLCRSAKIIPLPVVVTLTRISSRKLDDDNLATGFKAVRDGVADALGYADNHPLISWRYAQGKGAPSAAHVEIVGV